MYNSHSRPGIPRTLESAAPPSDLTLPRNACGPPLISKSPGKSPFVSAFSPAIPPGLTQKTAEKSQNPNPQAQNENDYLPLAFLWIVNPILTKILTNRG